jgi:hypothetical protein
MNILFIHPNLCKRIYNQVCTLAENNKDIQPYLLCGQPDVSANSTVKKIETITKDSKKLPSLHLPFSYKRYKKVIKSYCQQWDIDLIHAYGMPDDFVVAAIECQNVPVIFDLRDVVTTFSKNLIASRVAPKQIQLITRDIVYKYVSLIEKKAIEQSSATIFSSECMLEYAQKKYTITKNNVVFYNYALDSESPKKKEKKFSDDDGQIHLGFTGNISVYDNYRNFLPNLQMIAEKKIHVHMHVITKDNESLVACKKAAEKTPYLHLYTPMPLPKVLIELSKCDYGLLPFFQDVEKKYLDTILPTKLFDCLSAGLPIASSNINCVQRFLEKNNVGFVYNNLDDLLQQLKQNSKKYTVNPKDFLIGEKINKLVDFYQQVV